jgi:KDO2-lipid IV(A) lauroyltransferase
LKKFKPHRHVLFFGLQILEKILNSLPYETGFRLSETLGYWAYHFASRERKTTLENLKSVFGNEKSEAEITRIAKEVFANFARSIYELMVSEKIVKRWDDFVRVEGLPNLEKALLKKKGAVVIAGHIGNWELLAGYLGRQGYPCTVVARRVYFEKYNEWIVNFRKRMKVTTIYRDAPVRDVLSALRGNNLVGFVADQDTDGIDGVFVKFFGRDAWTPTSPVRFAKVAEAPLVPVFIKREGMRHTLIVGPELVFEPHSDKEEELKINTQKWVSLQEEFIRRFPDQWVWNHRRWRTKPRV